MSTKSRIEAVLDAGLAPERLLVIDESHRHAGHKPEFKGGEGTHMRVRIVSARFTGMGRIERHRLIKGLLKPELDAGLHALAIEAAAPGEPTGW